MIHVLLKVIPNLANASVTVFAHRAARLSNVEDQIVSLVDIKKIEKQDVYPR